MRMLIDYQRKGRLKGRSPCIYASLAGIHYAVQNVVAQENQLLRKDELNAVNSGKDVSKIQCNAPKSKHGTSSIMLLETGASSACLVRFVALLKYKLITKIIQNHSKYVGSVLCAMRTCTVLCGGVRPPRPEASSFLSLSVAC